ncbi:hypothetical protein [Streptomyces rochei]
MTAALDTAAGPTGQTPDPRSTTPTPEHTTPTPAPEHTTPESQHITRAPEPERAARLEAALGDPFDPANPHGHLALAGPTTPARHHTPPRRS